MQRRQPDWFRLISSDSPDVFDGGSFHGVHLQHVFEEAYYRRVQILRGEKDPVADLFKERWHVVVVEGERPTQQGIEDDPAAPDIDLWTSIQPEDVGNNKQSWSYEGHTLLD